MRQITTLSAVIFLCLFMSLDTASAQFRSPRAKTSYPNKRQKKAPIVYSLYAPVAINLPFYFFDGDDRDSIVNSYLLSHLSMAVYSASSDLSDFQDEVEERLVPLGIAAGNIHAFNSWTGTQGAVVETADAVIVVFRGTSSEGVTSLGGGLEDFITDLNGAMVPYSFPHFPVTGVHHGFLIAQDSVFDEVQLLVDDAMSRGKKLWLTGHSLGGSLAALTAMNFHYRQFTEVQGLQTFGAPFVGDPLFAAASRATGVFDASLASRTERWIMDGDPIPFFPVFSFAAYMAPYAPFGKTNRILRTGSGYEFTYNTSGVPAFPDLDGAFDEHMSYEEAMLFEMRRRMEAAGNQFVADKVEIN
jgi:hypothetical protein